MEMKSKQSLTVRRWKLGVTGILILLALSGAAGSKAATRQRPGTEPAGSSAGCRRESLGNPARRNEGRQRGQTCQGGEVTGAIAWKHRSRKSSNKRTSG